MPRNARYQVRALAIVMAGQSEHDQILAAAAREALAPLGLKRKGRSRTHLSDEGIWSCLVEFQPSGSSRGSYLNVAAHWLWTTSDQISLDYGGRVGPGFIEFRRPEDVAGAARRLVSAAVEAVQGLRRTFGSIDDIARVLVQTEHEQVRLGRGGCWGAYNAAVASGLTGDSATARALFLSVAHGVASSDWMRERQADALGLAALTRDMDRFREIIMARVEATRARLGMRADISPRF